MTNFAHGRSAEAAAADYLRRKGYKILAQNWRTKYCEIDIVVAAKNTIYFVEVKFRLNSSQGEGLDYITTKKLDQMRFAAEVWVNDQGWTGDYCLAAMEVSGESFRTSELLLLD